MRKTLSEQEKVLDEDLNEMEREADGNLQKLKHMDALMMCLEDILPAQPLPKELRNAQCQAELDAANPYEDGAPPSKPRSSSYPESHHPHSNPNPNLDSDSEDEMVRMKQNLRDMEEAGVRVTGVPTLVSC